MNTEKRKDYVLGYKAGYWLLFTPFSVTKAEWDENVRFTKNTDKERKSRWKKWKMFILWITR